MLDFQRHRAIDPQHKCRRFLRLSLHRPRPLDFQWFAMGRYFGTCDFDPAGDELARRKSLLCIGVGKDVAEQDGKRLCRDRTGFGHGVLYTTSFAVDGTTAVMAGQKREARLRARCPGHPRLDPKRKTWMP